MGNFSNSNFGDNNFRNDNSPASPLGNFNTANFRDNCFKTGASLIARPLASFNAANFRRDNFRANSIFVSSINELSVSITDNGISRKLTEFRIINEIATSITDIITRIRSVPRTILEAGISIVDTISRIRTTFVLIPKPFYLQMTDMSNSHSLDNLLIGQGFGSVSIQVTKLKMKVSIFSGPPTTGTIQAFHWYNVSSGGSSESIVASSNEIYDIASLSNQQELLFTFPSYSASLLSGVVVGVLIQNVDVGVVGGYTSSTDIIPNSDLFTKVFGNWFETTNEDMWGEIDIVPPSISLTDSISRTRVVPRSISESSISISSLISRMLTALRSIIDPSISSTDSISRTLISKRNIFEQYLYYSRPASGGSYGMSTSSILRIGEFINMTNPAQITSLSASVFVPIGATGTIKARVWRNAIVGGVNFDPEVTSNETIDLSTIADGTTHTLTFTFPQYPAEANADTVIGIEINNTSSSVAETVTIGQNAYAGMNIRQSDSSVSGGNWTNNTSNDAYQNIFVFGQIIISDSISRTRVVPRTISEFGTSISDSISRTLTALRSIIDPSISLTDSISRTRVVPRSINETGISSSDTISRTLTAIRNIVDTLSSTDSISRTLLASRTINESDISTTDSITAIKSVPRSINETGISLTDSISRTLLASRTINEIVSIFDAIIERLLAERSISEPSISSSDTISEYIIYPRNISESGISSTDSISYYLILSRAINEMINIFDSILRNLIASRMIIDSNVVITDIISRFIQLKRNISEVISIIDSIARKLVSNRSISEPSISLTDSISRTRVVPRSINENPLTLSESIRRVLRILRSMVDPTIFSIEFIFRRIFTGRSISDIINLSDSISRIFLVHRFITELSVFTSDVVNQIKLKTKIANAWFTKRKTLSELSNKEEE